jgi:hypothetical protein
MGVGAGCGTEDNRPAEWSFIAPVIMAPNCATASCHSRGAAVSGLDLSTVDDGYASLMKQKATSFYYGEDMPEAVSRPLVTPCRPDQSRIINMMKARGAQRMPPDRPMSQSDIALVEQWILDGARKNPTDKDPCLVEAMPAPVAGMGGTP